LPQTEDPPFDTFSGYPQTSPTECPHRYTEFVRHMHGNVLHFQSCYYNLTMSNVHRIFITGLENALALGLVLCEVCW
jgi:hypothetical protein